MKVFSNILFLLILGSSISCSKVKELPLEKYMLWVNDPENGLVNIQDLGGYTFKAKFLPKEFLKVRERQSSQDTTGDKYYSNTMTFSVNISINKKMHDKYGGDIMKTNVEGYEGYRTRMYDANFHIKEYFYITVGGNKIYPLLTTLENTQGLTSGVTLIGVFPIQDSKNINYDVDLTFEDELFGTGLHHFKFHNKNLLDLPKPI